MFFSLTNNLNTDITRPVSDMAALFGYELAAEAALRLRVEQQTDGVSVVLLNGEQVLRTFEPLARRYRCLQQ